MRASRAAISQLEDNILLAEELREYALGRLGQLPEIPGFHPDESCSPSDEDLRTKILTWHVTFFKSLSMIYVYSQIAQPREWPRHSVTTTNDTFDQMLEALVLRLQKLPAHAAQQ